MDNIRLPNRYLMITFLSKRVIVSAGEVAHLVMCWLLKHKVLRTPSTHVEARQGGTHL